MWLVAKGPNTSHVWSVCSYFFESLCCCCSKSVFYADFEINSFLQNKTQYHCQPYFKRSTALSQVKIFVNRSFFGSSLSSRIEIKIEFNISSQLLMITIWMYFFELRWHKTQRIYKGRLISESFSILNKMCPSHYPEYFAIKKKMLNIVIWHIFWRMEPKWKTLWD